MAMIIINSSKKEITSQKKQYGKLLVETALMKENNSTITVGANHHINKENVLKTNSGQPPISTDTKVNDTKVNNTIKLNNMEKRKLVNITKSIKLGKGQKLSLNQNCRDISKLIVTFDYKTILNSHNEFDLDASVFMVDINNKTAEKDFIFYENTKSTCGGIAVNQDHNTSLNEAYNECIQLDLNLIPPHIQKLAFTITVYEATERNQNFGQVSEGYFRIIVGDTKEEIINYNFNENLSIETAIVVAEIYRYKNEWKINCIGSGFRGGLEALCDNYGIETI